MTKSEATAPRPYSWLLILISVLPVIMLMIGAIAFRYIETRMIATAGETLALSASEVSDKVDRFLMERHADAVMKNIAFSTVSRMLTVEMVCSGRWASLEFNPNTNSSVLA